MLYIIMKPKELKILFDFLNDHNAYQEFLAEFHHQAPILSKGFFGDNVIELYNFMNEEWKLRLIEALISKLESKQLD